MIRKTTPLFFLALSCFCCTLLFAQDKGARDRLSFAHAQYYTPTASGLRSFQCDATIDWKAMLTRMSGTEISAESPGLKYLETVHLSVADELHGKGSLEWASPDAPPEGKEQAMEASPGRSAGLDRWILSDLECLHERKYGAPSRQHRNFVTRSGEGVHLSGLLSKETKFDEDFDKNMLLTQVLVDSPNIKVLAIPTYMTTPDGLLVSAVTSQVNQPPSAPQTEATIRIAYAKVDSFQIPSRIVLDIKNTGVIDFGLSGCKVSVAEWAKRPENQ